MKQNCPIHGEMPCKCIVGDKERATKGLSGYIPSFAPVMGAPPQTTKVVGMIEFEGKIIIATEQGVFYCDDIEQGFKPLPIHFRGAHK
jgi:hypothetical protein